MKVLKYIAVFLIGGAASHSATSRYYGMVEYGKFIVNDSYVLNHSHVLLVSSENNEIGMKDLVLHHFCTSYQNLVKKSKIPYDITETNPNYISQRAAKNIANYATVGLEKDKYVQLCKSSNNTLNSDAASGAG